MPRLKDKINQLINKQDASDGHLSDDELDSLSRMHHAVMVNSTLVQFSDVIQNNSQSLNQLCDAVIRGLMTRFNCSYGALLIYSKQNDELELVSEYGGDSNHQRTLTIKPSTGLTGQAFSDAQTKYLTSAPSGYTYTVRSGTGTGQATNILIVPALFNNQPAGIIELATFNKFTETDITLVERIAERCAATVFSLQAASENARLIEELKTIHEKSNNRMQLQYESQQKMITQVLEKSRKREKELLEEIERLKRKL